jgi:hypothetical protein
MDNLSFQSSTSIQRIDKIQELLRQQSMTLQELADGINISTRYAREYINHLQETRCVYIADFRKANNIGNARGYVPLYRWGSGPNAAMPEREHKAKAAERTIKLYGGDEKQDRDKAIRKARAIKPFRDWTAAWIPTRGAV